MGEIYFTAENAKPAKKNKGILCVSCELGG
jgi:hypothetical protein